MDEVITMLDELLDNSKEEILQQYLEQHKKILIAAFGQPEWVYNFVLPKFKFGSDYISDFVVFTGQSYSYWIKLIELEPSTSQVFTKQGDYAQRLNHAIKQVDEWSDWIKRNKPYFRDCLQKALQKEYPSFSETLDYTRRFIVSSKIVIGRRATLSVDDNKRRAQEYEKSNLDIITYDRLVDIEQKITQTEKEGKPFSRFWYDD